MLGQITAAYYATYLGVDTSAVYRAISRGLNHTLGEQLARIRSL